MTPPYTEKACTADYLYIVKLPLKKKEGYLGFKELNKLIEVFMSKAECNVHKPLQRE